MSYVYAPPIRTAPGVSPGHCQCKGDYICVLYLQFLRNYFEE